MTDEVLIPCPVCGELIEDYARFHWAPPFTDPVQKGHYTDGHVKAGSLMEAPEAAEEPEGMAPAPPDRQKLPKGLDKDSRRLLKKALIPYEDDVRWNTIDYLRSVGYQAYNMEQGHRPDGGHTRVGVGIGDTYFQGHGRRGWIEFKRPDPDRPDIRKMQTADQKKFERHELANGGIYLLVESRQQVVAWHEAHMETLAQQEIEL